MKSKFRGILALALMLVICLLIANSMAESTTTIHSTIAGEIAVGQSLELTYDLENANDLGNAKIEWKSSDADIISVSKDKMTGKAIGTAQIVCKATFRNGMVFTDKVAVEVYAPVKSITLIEKELSLNAGETQILHIPAIEPAEAKYQNVVWTSSNETIVAIDNTGTVTAIKAGKAFISATTADPAGEKVKAATCEVTVFQPTESIAFEQSSTEINKGGKLVLTPTFTPEDASDKNLIWASSNEDIVKVDSFGIALGKATGTAIVLVRDAQGHEATITVQVYLPVKKVDVSQNKITLETSKTQAITVMIEPSEAKYQTVVWASSDESIATVDQSGVITAVMAGKSMISATTTDPAGGKIKVATCEVSVFQPTKAIAFAQETLAVGKGKKLKVTPVFYPVSASDKNLTWTTSDSAILTSDNKGVISGQALGTATLSIVDAQGHVANCIVNVYIPVTTVTLSEKTMTLKVGETSDVLLANIKPTDAKYQMVTWGSSDESVAIVNEKGEVTALKAGVVCISATSDDPSSIDLKATVCEVTVLQPVTGLAFVETSLRLPKSKTRQLEPTFEPEDASVREMIWKSNNESVATVNDNGVVTGKGNGKAILIGETTDGTGVKCSIEVEVYQPVSKITAKSAAVAVTMTRSRNLEVKVSPKDASNPTLKWISSNPSVATVSSDGTINGVTTGSCTITTSATDGSGEEYKFKLTVEPTIPVDTPTIWRSGYFGFYNRLSIDVTNQNTARTIKSISFTVYVDSSSYDCTANVRIAPGKTKRTKSWGLGGLTFADDIKIYLNSIEYTDGTYDSYWGNTPLLGSFL